MTAERRSGGKAEGVRPSLFPVACLLLAACQASTTRPEFGPLPGPATAELHLAVPEATRVLAAALASDSVPLRRTVERDGVIESEWFEVPGYGVATRRTLGPDVVRVRAWVDPGKPGHSLVTLEAAYRVYADPSRAPREQEQPVAGTHPARVKVVKLLERLIELHGDPADQPASARPARRAPADTAARDTTATISRP